MALLSLPFVLFGCSEKKRKGKEKRRTLVSFIFFFLRYQNGISVISEAEDNAIVNVQFGAFPVFVVDGTPSPLKSQARVARFFRGSGIDLSGLPVGEEGVSVERNAEFSRRVQECVVSFLPLPSFAMYCYIFLMFIKL